MREYERDLAMYDDYADKLHFVDEGKYKKWLKKHLPKMSFKSNFYIMRTSNIIKIIIFYGIYPRSHFSPVHIYRT